MAEAINPRYFHFARIHGRTPDEQLAHDQVRWPGGCMTGFILWIPARWAEWREFNPLPREQWGHGEDARKFDEWLAALPVGHQEAQCASTPRTQPATASDAADAAH